jgi:hypothetical protein
VILIEEDLDSQEDPLPPLEEEGPQHAVEEEEKEGEKDEESFLLNFEDSLWKSFGPSGKGLDLSSKDLEMEEKREEEWEILLEGDEGSSGTLSVSDSEKEGDVLSQEKGDASFPEAVSERSSSGVSDVQVTPQDVEGIRDRIKRAEPAFP